MFIILVYDINVERVNKVLKIARKYLTWVQNSVLEGELTKNQFVKFRDELKKVININEDSVIFYKMRSKKYYTKETLGITKGAFDIII
jgi:CRISPR-associated protein Cas2